MTMKTAALYKRVSTDEQVNGTSLQTQEEALRAYCRDNGLAVYAVYTDDGYSGATADRPGLKKLLSAANDKKFNTILVYRTDRIMRSIFESVKLVLNDFDKMGITFKSITESYDTTTPIGRMHFVDLAKYADYERAVIRERSMLGRRRRAREGKMMAPMPPYGYCKDTEGVWAIQRDHAKIYQRMMQWVLDGVSLRSIVNKLNGLNIPSARGKVWKMGSLHAILRRPVYKGIGHYGGETFSVPPLVTESRWQAVQEALKANRNSTQPHAKHFHLLRSLLYCSCGRRFFSKANAGKDHPARYECISLKPDPFPRYCGMPSVQQKDFNGPVWENVVRLVKDGNFLRQVLESNKLTQNKDMVTHEAEVVILDRAIKGKGEEIDRILSLYARSKAMNVEELDKAVGTIKTQLEALSKERQTLLEGVRRHEMARAAVKDLETLLAQVRRRIDKFTDAQKREFLLRTVERVNVVHDGKDHQLEIHFKFQVSKPPNPDNSVSMVLSAFPVMVNW